MLSFSSPAVRLAARASCRPVATALPARTYATSRSGATNVTKAAATSGSRPIASQTGESDLHPIPSSVRPAAGSSIPSSTGSGNSTDPADLSSRPAAPGPSAPDVDPSVAAPSLVQRRPDGSQHQDWATSFSGMSSQPFDGKVAEVLSEPLNEEDIEIKPDGLIYLPEIKYRRILTRAFGPGGWGLAPRGETNVGQKIVSREWVLVCHGRFVSTARGEQEYFNPSGVATASEGAKSNALMRCCKDLGIASELWDPRFIRTFKKKHCVEVFCENASDGKKKKLWRRRDQPPFEWPWKESR